MPSLSCPGCDTKSTFTTSIALKHHQKKCQGYQEYYRNKKTARRVPKRRAPVDSDELAKRQRVEAEQQLVESSSGDAEVRTTILPSSN